VVQDVLSAAGLGWGRHIVAPAHRQPGNAHLVRNGESHPVSDVLSAELISFPVFPELTDEQVERVADVLSKVEVSV
jgi:dTDP-4-amino-4,6-dideoxygalactose transaminase